MRSAFPPRRSAFRFTHSAFPPRGLTLIELLVTIVILVTVLGAVLPAISPNNEARKIREASRQLTSLLAQAQAQAARDGRVVGVGYRDWDDANNNLVLDPGEADGMALEAFIVAEPPPFSGFSENSAVLVDQIPMNDRPWRRRPPQFENPNLRSLYSTDEPFNITFCHNVGGESFLDDPRLGDVSDALPPSTFRVGDIVEVGREQFQIVADDIEDIEDQDSLPDVDNPNASNWRDYGYLKSQRVVAVRWLNRHGRINLLLPPGGRAYKIRRKPMAADRPSRTSAATIQFPRGVGIDMDPTEGNFQAAVVFSPTGELQAEYRDGNEIDRRESVFILLGRVENANDPTQTPEDFLARYDFRGGVTDDELARRREEVNLFSPDSRWVAISPAGRVVAAKNFIFDPREVPNDDNTGLFINSLSGTELEQLQAQRDKFREVAQRYARQFENEGGR